MSLPDFLTRYVRSIKKDIQIIDHLIKKFITKEVKILILIGNFLKINLENIKKILKNCAYFSAADKCRQWKITNFYSNLRIWEFVLP